MLERQAAAGEEPTRRCFGLILVLGKGRHSCSAVNHEGLVHIYINSEGKEPTFLLRRTSLPWLGNLQMQCYTELCPPTAVTHSLSLPFLSASANNLIVVKTSLIQIYSLKSILAPASDKSLSADSRNAHRVQSEFDNGGSTLPRGDRLPTTKLVLIAQHDLSGTVTAIARIKILKSKSGGEAILVALRDAKLSLIEWDPERFSISTISIHYYEREDVFNNPWEPDLGQGATHLSVDPGSRCAILRFGVRHVAILPFHQVGDDLVMDDYDPDIDGERLERRSSNLKSATDADDYRKTPYAASFVLSLLALDPSLSHPVYLSFLYQYREPTFGILYSQVASSPGLLHERRDNVSYAVYTLDLDQRASTTLSTVNNLPWDLFAVVPLLRNIGGALLLGTNELIHVDQSGKPNGIAVNDLAKQSTSFPLADQSDLNLRLEDCVVKELGLDNTTLLIILNTGRLAILSFKIDGRSVSGLAMHLVEPESGGTALLASPSSASVIGRGRIFVGSQDSDSIILGWSRKSDRLKRRSSRLEMDVDDDIDILGMDEEDVEDDEDDLYADNKPDDPAQEKLSTTTATENVDYFFRVHDTLTNIAPMTDVTLRPSVRNPSNPISHHDAGRSMCIVTSSGRGRAGGLSILQRDIRAEQADEYGIDNIQGLWSISLKQQESKTVASSQRPYDRYLFACSSDDTRAERSVVYRIQGRHFEELKDVEFDSDAGDTVDVSTINGGTTIAVISRFQVRTYDAGESQSVSYSHFGVSDDRPNTESQYLGLDLSGNPMKPGGGISLFASLWDCYTLFIRVSVMSYNYVHTYQ